VYSRLWYELFSRTIPPEQTEREVAFITRQLPRPSHPKLLDLCCGEGRHAMRLAALGYEVTGVDERDPPSSPAFKFIRRDMRDLNALGTFDGVLSLWQSFGYFPDEQNQQVLDDVAGLLNPDGRFILDIYNREFFEQNQGVREFARAGITVTETKCLTYGRLSVHLDYGGGRSDSFEWRVYTPHEIRTVGGEAGLTQLLVCRSFDETQPPSPDEPRMQLVFRRA
jgi:SAM-dependent methyltransferase